MQLSVLGAVQMDGAWGGGGGDNTPGKPGRGEGRGGNDGGGDSGGGGDGEGGGVGGGGCGGGEGGGAGSKKTISAAAMDFGSPRSNVIHAFSVPADIQSV
jgi:hypothetical protein